MTPDDQAEFDDAGRRLCACGCGWPVSEARPGARYATRACIERAQRMDTQAYREHAAEEAAIAAVPGRVLGTDVEGQADALADAAARLAALLSAFSREPRPSLDVITVFRALSRSAESMAAAAAELRRQDWFDLGDDAEPEAVAAWNGALEGLKSASATFEWVADGWI